MIVCMCRGRVRVRVISSFIPSNHCYAAFNIVYSTENIFLFFMLLFLSSAASSQFNITARILLCPESKQLLQATKRNKLVTTILCPGTVVAAVAAPVYRNDQSSVTLAFEEMHTPYAKEREICVQKFGNAYR